MTISPNEAGATIIGFTFSGEYHWSFGRVGSEVFQNKTGDIYWTKIETPMVRVRWSHPPSFEVDRFKKPYEREMKLTLEGNGKEWEEMPEEQVYSRFKEHKEQFDAMKALSSKGPVTHYDYQ